MDKNYMVVQFGVSKKTGKPYSIAQRMIMANDGTWGRLNPKDQFFTDDIRGVGEIVRVQQQEVS